jgi:hypothetical protein
VLVVPDATALTKIAWSFYYGGESGLARLPPASVSLIARNAVNLYVAYRLREKLSLWRYWPVVSV